MIKNLLISAILLGSATLASATGVVHSSVSSPFYVGAGLTVSRAKTQGPWVKTDKDGKAQQVKNAAGQDVDVLSSKHMTMYGVNLLAGYKFTENVSFELETGFSTGSVSQSVFEGNVKEELVVLPATVPPAAAAPVCTEKKNFRTGEQTKKKLKLNRVPLFVNAKWEDSINDSFGYYAKVGVGVEFLSGKLTTTESIIKDEVTGGTCAAPTIEDKGDKTKNTSVSTKLKSKVRPALQAEIGMTYQVADNVNAFLSIGASFSKKAKMKASVKQADDTFKTENILNVGGFVPQIKAGLTVAF